MSPSKALLDQFLALSEDEREVFLAAANDIGPADSDVEKAWLEESVQRAEAYFRGEGETLSAAQAEAELDAAFGKI